MMDKQGFRHAWLLAVLITVSLACQVLSDIGERVQQTRNQVESAATDIKQGRNFLGTARSIATQVGNSEMLQTAMALATELGESGLLETARAFATEQGPGLIETVQGFATQQGPGLVETAQALATQHGPGLLETAQAVATQAARASGNPPADIPLIEGEKEMLFASSELVSYTTGLTFQEVLQFYKAQMPANGWEKIEQGWVETGNTAVLQFEKPDRKAVVTLNADGRTIVIITIQPN
jgi:hypothetical protein